MVGSTSGGSDLIDIAAVKRDETESALLLDDGVGKAWVPKSMVEDNGDGTWAMPEWLATVKRFI